jgi:lipid-binding SYLF domain-containing protein
LVARLIRRSLSFLKFDRVYILPVSEDSMHRRLIKTFYFLSLAVFCAFLTLPVSTWAGSATEIDAKVNSSLRLFYQKVGPANELSGRAKGILVFPDVIKAGFGIGGEYGEGALRINGKTVDYYNTAAASIGLQIGAQSKTVILMFLDFKALNDFRNSDGWEVGVDGSVAVVEWGAGESIDTTNIKETIVGFVLGNKGLMFNLTLEGSKMSKIRR